VSAEEASDAREVAIEPGAPVAVPMAPPIPEVMVSRRFWACEREIG